MPLRPGDTLYSVHVSSDGPRITSIVLIARRGKSTSWWTVRHDDGLEESLCPGGSWSTSRLEAAERFLIYQAAYVAGNSGIPVFGNPDLSPRRLKRLRQAIALYEREAAAELESSDDADAPPIPASPPKAATDSAADSPSPDSDAPPEQLATPILMDELSTRLRNILAREGMVNYADVERDSASRLLGLANFGETTLRELERLMRRSGRDMGWLHR